MELKREDIVKALASCVIGDCEPCAYRKFVDCRDHMCGEALSLINELTEENERWRAIPEQLHKEMSELMVEECKIARKLAVRKMQERLNKRFGRDKNRVHTDYNVHRYIDQIAKEMIGEEND